MWVSNEKVRKRANMETISEQVNRRRWTWIGHVLEMDNSSLPQFALTRASEGKRKRERLREIWCGSVEKNRMLMDY